MKKPTLYIAGPMTGLPDLNFPAFHAAARELRAQGFDVVNPAEINPDQHLSWQACMRTDIAALVFCDGIQLLPGWQASKGATLEHHIAERLGLQITYPVGEEAPQPPGVVAYHYKFKSKWCGDVRCINPKHMMLTDYSQLAKSLGSVVMAGPVRSAAIAKT